MSDDPRIAIDYQYDTAEAAHTQAYLATPVVKILGELQATKVFDLGCGNGAFARHLKERGFSVVGVDPSAEGINEARKADSTLRLEVGSAYEPLESRFGVFPAVVSLEVVEHVYYPRKYAKAIFDLLEPGGHAIISTPYHGYLKNLVIALTGKADSHYTALWDHGHIKFWSIATLSRLFIEQGMPLEKVLRVGRIPVLAKSMILVFRKP